MLYLFKILAESDLDLARVIQADKSSGGGQAGDPHLQDSGMIQIVNRISYLRGRCFAEM